MCGGKSSRVRQECGLDKTLLPLGSYASITEFLLAKLSRLFDTVFLSSKEHKFGDSFDYILDLDHVGKVDTSKLYAPTLSIYSSLKMLNHKTLFVPADMPLLEGHSIKKLLSIQNNHDAVVLRVEGKVFPTCAIYNTTVLPILETMIAKDRHKLKLFLDEIDTIYVDLPHSEEFKNINTYNEYLEIKER